METRQYTVIGRVQGVGYRWYVSRKANALGVSGWIRNRSNGTVEVLAQASVQILADFEDLLRKGPSGAYVREIQTEITAMQNLNDNFDIII